jgi:DNA-binding HxlR family transcriptional regulator
VLLVSLKFKLSLPSIAGHGGSHEAIPAVHVSPAAGTTPRPCSIADALDLLGERWALLVVRELFWGNHRFADIARHTGAPRDVLSARLRRLVEAGVIEKRRYTDRPPRDGYYLTEAGRDLAPVLASLTQWSREHLPTTERRPNVAHHDHEIDPVVDVRCRTCGERLA